jgi:hypothetical protein
MKKDFLQRLSAFAESEGTEVIELKETIISYDVRAINIVLHPIFSLSDPKSPDPSHEK